MSVGCFPLSQRAAAQPRLLCGTGGGKLSSTHKSPMHPAVGWGRIKPWIVLSMLRGTEVQSGVQGSCGFVQGSGFGQRVAGSNPEAQDSARRTRSLL